MRNTTTLTETLSKIESLAEAALYLTTSDEERQLQFEMISLIVEIAGSASMPAQEACHA